MSTQNNPLPKSPQAKGEQPSPPRASAGDDLSGIRKAVIRCVLCLVAGAAAVTGSRMVAAAIQNDKAKAQTIRDEMRARADQAETEKREIHDFQPKYMQLRAHGLIGEERRLDWIDYMRDIQEKRNLAPITYGMAAQQTFDVDPSVLSGDLKLHGAKITVGLKLLHDMDLFYFFDDLGKWVLYAPQSCTITRIVGAADDSLEPHLDAECTLYWLTMSTEQDPAAPAR